MKILVVEDNIYDQRFLEGVLSTYADELYFIDGKGNVLDWVYKVDLIILDLNLGLVQGKQLLKKIKRKRKVVPVIIYTTSANPDDIKECYTLGAACYVTKPFGLADTVEKISKLGEFWKGVMYAYQSTGL